MTRVLGVLVLAMGIAAAGCQSSSDHNNRESNGAVSPNDGMAGGAMGANDSQFVKDAAAGGNYEVEAGKLAESKGMSDKVKMIGGRMVTDHTKAGKELMGIANKEGIAVPPGMTGDQEAMVSRLNGLQGGDFDKEYLKQQEAAHRETIAKFEGESTGGSDAALRSFATKTLPTLREHLKMITGAEGGSTGM